MIFNAVPKKTPKENDNEQASQEISTLQYFLEISKEPEEFLMHMEYFPKILHLLRRKQEGKVKILCGLL